MILEAVVMQLLFVVVAISGLFYFMFSKRVFDFFSIAYISACVYFLPGFYGHVGRQQQPLVDSAYLVMIMVLSLIFLGALFLNRSEKRNKKRYITIRGTNLVVVVAVLLGLIGFSMSLFELGPSLFTNDKMLVRGELGKWYLLWIEGALLGLVLSYLQKRRSLFIISFLLIIVDFYIGFRTTLAIAVMSIFVSFLSEQGRIRFAIDNKKLCIYGFISGLFFFSYKGIYALVKLGRLDLVFNNLGNFQYYIGSIRASEPFTTQLILNEVIMNNFKVGIDHFTNVIYQLVLFAPQLGFQRKIGFDDFANELFPHATHGMASNIWAEMWSSGGWLLLTVFILFFVLIIYAGSKFLMRLKDSSMTALLSIVMCYWTFYIHRNSFNYEINLIKRSILFWIFCYIVSAVMTKLAVKNKPRADFHE